MTLVPDASTNAEGDFASLETSQGFLVLLDSISRNSRQNQRIFNLKIGSNSIGRCRSADCCLNILTVSKCHAEIILQESAAFIMDCGSTQGTFKCRRSMVKLEPNVRYDIQDGEKFRIADVTMMFTTNLHQVHVDNMTYLNKDETTGTDLHNLEDTTVSISDQPDKGISDMSSLQYKLDNSSTRRARRPRRSSAAQFLRNFMLNELDEELILREENNISFESMNSSAILVPDSDEEADCEHPSKRHDMEMLSRTNSQLVSRAEDDDWLNASCVLDSQKPSSEPRVGDVFDFSVRSGVNTSPDRDSKAERDFLNDTTISLVEGPKDAGSSVVAEENGVFASCNTVSRSANRNGLDQQEADVEEETIDESTAVFAMPSQSVNLPAGTNWSSTSSVSGAFSRDVDGRRSVSPTPGRLPRHNPCGVDDGSVSRLDSRDVVNSNVAGVSSEGHFLVFDSFDKNDDFSVSVTALSGEEESGGGESLVIEKTYLKYADNKRVFECSDGATNGAVKDCSDEISVSTFHELTKSGDEVFGAPQLGDVSSDKGFSVEQPASSSLLGNTPSNISYREVFEVERHAGDRKERTLFKSIYVDDTMDEDENVGMDQTSIGDLSDIIKDSQEPCTFLPHSADVHCEISTEVENNNNNNNDLSNQDSDYLSAKRDDAEIISTAKDSSLFGRDVEENQNGPMIHLVRDPPDDGLNGGWIPEVGESGICEPFQQVCISNAGNTGGTIIERQNIAEHVVDVNCDNDAMPTVEPVVLISRLHSAIVEPTMTVSTILLSPKLPANGQSSVTRRSLRRRRASPEGAGSTPQKEAVSPPKQLHVSGDRASTLQLSPERAEAASTDTTRNLETIMMDVTTHISVGSSQKIAVSPNTSIKSITGKVNANEYPLENTSTAHLHDISDGCGPIEAPSGSRCKRQILPHRIIAARLTGEEKMPGDVDSLDYSLELGSFSSLFCPGYERQPGKERFNHLSKTSVMKNKPGELETQRNSIDPDTFCQDAVLAPKLAPKRTACRKKQLQNKDTSRQANNRKSTIVTKQKSKVLDYEKSAYFLDNDCVEIASVKNNNTPDCTGNKRCTRSSRNIGLTRAKLSITETASKTICDVMKTGSEGRSPDNLNAAENSQPVVNQIIDQRDLSEIEQQAAAIPVAKSSSQRTSHRRCGKRVDDNNSESGNCTQIMPLRKSVSDPLKHYEEFEQICHDSTPKARDPSSGSTNRSQGNPPAMDTNKRHERLPKSASKSCASTHTSSPAFPVRRTTRQRAIVEGRTINMSPICSSSKNKSKLKAEVDVENVSIKNTKRNVGLKRWNESDSYNIKTNIVASKAVLANKNDAEDDAPPIGANNSELIKTASSKSNIPAIPSLLVPDSQAKSAYEPSLNTRMKATNVPNESHARRKKQVNSRYNSSSRVDKGKNNEIDVNSFGDSGDCNPASSRINGSEQISLLHSKTCIQTTSRRKASRTNALGPRSSEITGYASSRLRLATNKPSVMFSSGSHDEELVKIVKNLGGSVVEDPSASSVMVTHRMCRTVKFLSAVASGTPIVARDWLCEAKRLGSFPDPLAFIFTDPVKEKLWNFNLAHTLSASKHVRLFMGYEFVLTPSIKPPPNEMKELLESAGGEVHAKLPSIGSYDHDSLIVVSCEEDFEKCRLAIERGLTIVSNEFILSGILRHKIDVKCHKLFANDSAKLKKTKRAIL